MIASGPQVQLSATKIRTGLTSFEALVDCLIRQYERQGESMRGSKLRRAARPPQFAPAGRQPTRIAVAEKSLEPVRSDVHNREIGEVETKSIGDTSRRGVVSDGGAEVVFSRRAQTRFAWYDV